MVDEPADRSLREAVESCSIPFPKGTEFVNWFSGCKLYCHQLVPIIGVLAAPPSHSGRAAYPVDLPVERCLF